MPSRILKLAFSVAILGLFGCGSTFKNNVNFNPLEPLRVAIVPFAEINEQGQISQYDPNLLIDQVQLVSSEVKESPAEFVRKLAKSELSRSSLDIIPPALLDSNLVHHGFAVSSPALNRTSGNFFPMDIQRIYSVAPREICSQVVECDAVLYGKITKWDRSYYALQSSSTIALEFKLVSAKDNQILYTAQAEDSDSRGLSKGPTGFSSLVIEPIRGLDSEIIAELARATVNKMLKPLSAPARPDFLKVPPPAIYGSAHDANDGKITMTRALTVVVFGTPANAASFSLGGVENIPMAEVDAGHYIGEFYPLPNDMVSGESVVVSLGDKYGRITTQTVNNGPVSLVN